MGALKYWPIALCATFCLGVTNSAQAQQGRGGISPPGVNYAAPPSASSNQMTSRRDISVSAPTAEGYKSNLATGGRETSVVAASVGASTTQKQQMVSDGKYVVVTDDVGHTELKRVEPNRKPSGQGE